MLARCKSASAGCECGRLCVTVVILGGWPAQALLAGGCKRSGMRWIVNGTSSIRASRRRILNGIPEAQSERWVEVDRAICHESDCGLSSAAADSSASAGGVCTATDAGRADDLLTLNQFSKPTVASIPREASWIVNRTTSQRRIETHPTYRTGSATTLDCQSGRKSLALDPAGAS